MVGAGWVSPSEFWKMHPDEVWWLYEAKTPAKTKKSTFDRLYAMLD